MARPFIHELIGNEVKAFRCSLQKYRNEYSRPRLCVSQRRDMFLRFPYTTVSQVTENTEDKRPSLRAGRS